MTIKATTSYRIKALVSLDDTEDDLPFFPEHVSLGHPVYQGFSSLPSSQSISVSQRFVMFTHVVTPVAQPKYPAPQFCDRYTVYAYVIENANACS